MKNKKIIIGIGIVLCICLGVFLYNNSKSDAFFDNINWNETQNELGKKMSELEFYDYEGKVKKAVNGKEIDIYNNVLLSIDNIYANSKAIGLDEVPLNKYIAWAIYNDKNKLEYIEGKIYPMVYDFEEDWTEVEQIQAQNEDYDILYSSIITDLENKGEFIKEVDGRTEKGLLYKVKNHYVLVDTSNELEDNLSSRNIIIKYYNPDITIDDIENTIIF